MTTCKHNLEREQRRAIPNRALMATCISGSCFQEGANHSTSYISCELEKARKDVTTHLSAHEKADETVPAAYWSAIDLIEV